MLSVGQKLWYVPTRYSRGEAHEVTVESVGRKWASIGHRTRVDIETLQIDGGAYSSPGSCYVNRQAYEDELKLQQAWDAFQRLLRDRRMPAGITLEKIEHAKLSLGL